MPQAIQVQGAEWELWEAWAEWGAIIGSARANFAGILHAGRRLRVEGRMGNGDSLRWSERPASARKLWRGRQNWAGSLRNRSGPTEPRSNARIQAPKSPYCFRMPARDTRPVGWIGWSVLPIGIIAAGASLHLGDMAFICLKYGHRAYFAEGLRFIKHKPYTLSNGVVFSVDQGFPVWLVSIAIWLALIVGTVSLLVAVSALLRRIRARTGAVQSGS